VNVKQVVPFLHVSSIERSVRYYIDGLGFTMKNKWEPDGKLRWCWLELGGAALMLQQFPTEGHDSRTLAGKAGEGVSLCFQCEDALALYREFIAREIEASEPQVGNALWVTCLSDPDGYSLSFHSPTDTTHSPTDTTEETKLSEVK
jgi:hypothetical protein